MRAILPLFMVIAGCGNKGANTLEFDVAVVAPGAASVIVDGKAMITPSGGAYSRGFQSLAEASKVSGKIATTNSDGSVRAMRDYAFGTYCAAVTPLLRETQHYVEASDGSGAIVLSLDRVECERTDGTGTVVTP